MRGIKTILMIPVVVVLLLAGACWDSGLDNASSADVILEIVGFTTPPVTAAINTTGFCSPLSPTTACMVDADCPGMDICSIGGCTLTVVDWTASMSNVPKNSLAASPGNDIAMIQVLITYSNFSPAFATFSRTLGLGGQVIPTGGSGSINFAPLLLQDLPMLPTSSTGTLTMDFLGQTLEGTTIPVRAVRELAIEVCL